MSQYARGARFEYRVRDDLIKQGCFVVRAAGSRGPLDLVAFNEEQTGGKRRFVQCKVRREKMTKKEKLELCELARKYEAKAILAFKEDHRIIYEELEVVG